MIVVIAGSSSATEATWRMQLNLDGGDNYNWVNMAGNGSSGASAKFSVEPWATIIWYGATGTVSPTQSTTNILDYSATDKHKFLLTRSDTSTSATEAVGTRWANTAAVTSVKILTSTGTFNSGSTFSLYGIAA